MPETLAAAFVRAAAAPAPRGVTFLDLDERPTHRSWAALVERAQEVAGGLRRRGLGDGECVAIVLPTGPAFVEVFFGAQLAGCVPVPLYPPTRLGRLGEYTDRLAAMLAAVHARIVVTDRRAWPLLGAAIERAHPALGCITHERLVGPHRSDLGRPDGLALVQFSSGTTTEPKPVAVTHAQLLANVHAVLSRIRSVGASPASATSWLPLYHDMGLVGFLCGAVVEAGVLTLLPPDLFAARPAAWLRAMGRTGASVSGAPNFAYAACVDRVSDEDLDGVDLSGWRLALNAAEPVSPLTLRRFAHRFARWGFAADALTPAYGLAEATLAVTMGSPGGRVLRVEPRALGEGRVVPDPGGEEVVSVGRPLDGVEVDAPEGHVGPVRVRGPSVMAGYLHQPVRTTRALLGGWLNTGDLGFRLDGELYLVGRERDVLVVRGANHAPQALERAVDEVVGVRPGLCAVVGWRPPGAERERVVVLVEARVETPDLAERVRRAVAAASGVEPDDVVPLAPGSLPRTSSGKVCRGEALQRWLEGRLLPPERVDAARFMGLWGQGALAQLRARLHRPSA